MNMVYIGLGIVFFGTGKEGEDEYLTNRNDFLFYAVERNF
jgi:hypothetical protein